MICPRNRPSWHSIAAVTMLYDYYKSNEYFETHSCYKTVPQRRFGGHHEDWASSPSCKVHSTSSLSLSYYQRFLLRLNTPTFPESTLLFVPLSCRLYQQSAQLHDHVWWELSGGCHRCQISSWGHSMHRWVESIQWSIGMLWSEYLRLIHHVGQVIDDQIFGRFDKRTKGACHDTLPNNLVE